MNRRRPVTPSTPEQLLRQVLSSPIHWPGRTVRLERDSVADFRQRSTSPHVSLAELYHENSKLYRQILSELAMSSLDSSAVRREFLRRRSVATTSFFSGTELQGPVRELLAAVVGATGVEAFYAIEVWVMAGSTIALHEPVTGLLPVIKMMSPDEVVRVVASLRVSRSEVPEPTVRNPLIILAGSLARNEVLFGIRGYRRTLLEAGRIGEEILLEATKRRLAAEFLCEFIDRDIDRAIEADGVEIGTLAVVTLEEAKGVS